MVVIWPNIHDFVSSYLRPLNTENIFWIKNAVIVFRNLPCTLFVTIQHNSNMFEVRFPGKVCLKSWWNFFLPKRELRPSKNLSRSPFIECQVKILCLRRGRLTQNQQWSECHLSLLVRLFCLTALEKGFGCLGGSFQWVQTSIHICWPKPNRNVFSILRFNLSSSIPCVKKVCSENVLWVLGATWAKDYSGNLGRKHLSPGNVVLGLQWVWSGVRAKSGQLFGLRSNNPVCRHFEVWWTKTYALPCPIQPFRSIFTPKSLP